MDPFHVVRLAGDALDRCRRRVQQQLHGHRGRSGDPLYRARRTLHTGADLLTEKQSGRLSALFAVDSHVEVEVTWGIYQNMIAAYRHPDHRTGKQLMQRVIDGLADGVPAMLAEVITLGRTLRKCADDVLAYFDRPARHIQRPHGGDQWPPRAPARLSTGVPQPDQLHRQEPVGDRWLQTTTTPSNGMSQ